MFARSLFFLTLAVSLAALPMMAVAQSTVTVPAQQAATTAVAATGVVPIDGVAPFAGLTGPRALIATLIGVALALAFQLLLTNLTFAAGLNLAGATDGSSTSSNVTTDEESNIFTSATKTIDMVGLWAVITTTIALFFAGLLASTIGYAVHPESGAVLGLGVWALFLLIMVRLETRVLSSLAGSLFSVAGTTLSTALNSTRALAGTVGGTLAAPAGGETTQQLRHNLENSDATYRQKEQIRRMVARLQERADLTPESARELFYEFLHDPKHGTDELMARLGRINRDHVKEVLVEHEDISEEDAEEIITRYETTREDLVKSVDRTRTEAEQYALKAREAAGRSAERTRELAAHVAWWSFCTAILSGAAAAVGGTIAALLNV